MVWWLCALGACGDNFETSSPGEALPSGCAAWCERAATCVGVTAEACEQQCADQFPEEGTCGSQAAAVVACFETHWSATCQPPPQCLEEVKAFASCTGLGCPADNGICGEDAANDLDCRCGGGCGLPWQFQANCEEQSGDVACTCFLSGPIAAAGSLGTIESTCTGPRDGGGDYCQDGWGCCRAKLLQNP